MTEDDRKKPSDSPEVAEGEPSALDGGWAWAVLFSSFCFSVIVDGVCFSFGIFYLEFLDAFGEKKGKTAWIGSVLNGMYMITAPVASALVNRYGCRVVCIVGSVWSAAAFFACTFSPSVDVLIPTYGILGGIGFGMMYLPSIVIVGFYFDKKRAFATGIATCGSGVGAFIFAPLCRFLIDRYAWRGAMWIISGIVLNGAVLGAVYRPLTERQMDSHRRKCRKKHKLRVAKEEIPYEAGDMAALPTYVVGDTGLIITHNAASEPEAESEADLEDANEQSEASLLSDNSNGQLRHRKIAGSMNSLAAYATSVQDTQQGAGPADALGSRDTGCSGAVKSVARAVRDSIDLTVLRDPVFGIYALSCILCMAGFFTPFIYLPDVANSLGYGKHEQAFLLSILGITNTVGRVAVGWVSDRPWADSLLINNLALVIGGVATAFLPFCRSYALLAVYASIFGLCIAAFVALRPIILVDLMGLNKLTSSLGVLVLCQGITSFVGAPFAGFLYDTTNSYNLSFYVGGICVALGGLINLPLRRLARWRTTGTAPSTDDKISVKDSEAMKQAEILSIATTN